MYIVYIIIYTSDYLIAGGGISDPRNMNGARFSSHRCLAIVEERAAPAARIFNGPLVVKKHVWTL